MAEFILRVFGIPLPLAVLFYVIYTAIGNEGSLGVFATVYIIALIVTNGGWLIWDGDMDWFD